MRSENERNYFSPLKPIHSDTRSGINNRTHLMDYQDTPQLEYKKWEIL